MENIFIIPFVYFILLILSIISTITSDSSNVLHTYLRLALRILEYLLKLQCHRVHHLVLLLYVLRFLLQHLTLLNQLLLAFCQHVLLPTVSRARCCLTFLTYFVPNIVQVLMHLLNLFTVDNGNIPQSFIPFFEFQADFFFEGERRLQFVKSIFLLHHEIHPCFEFSLLFFYLIALFLVPLQILLNVCFLHFYSMIIVYIT